MTFDELNQPIREFVQKIREVRSEYVNRLTLELGRAPTDDDLDEYVFEDGSPQQEGFWKLQRTLVDDLAGRIRPFGSDVSWLRYQDCSDVEDLLTDEFHATFLRGSNDPPEVEPRATEILHAVEDLLHEPERRDWIACIPCERLFSSFPAFTDFGPFALVNSRHKNCQQDRFAELSAILRSNLGVTFHPPHETSRSLLVARDSLEKDKLTRLWESPVLVFHVGKGDVHHGTHEVRKRLNQWLPLLRVCQVAYEELEDFGSTSEDDYSLGELADGFHEHRIRQNWNVQFVQLPNRGIIIDKNSGTVLTTHDLFPFKYNYRASVEKSPNWVSGRPVDLTFELQCADEYDPDRFLGIWRELVDPLIQARGHQGFQQGKLGQAIDRAVRLIAGHVHDVVEELAVSAVIATETLLVSPFGAGGDIKERFALYIAALLETEPENRITRYGMARKLYGRRCDLVHNSNRGSIDSLAEDRRLATECFTKCLQRVVTWALSQIDAKKGVGEKEFSKFLIAEVFNRPGGTD